MELAKIVKTHTKLSFSKKTKGEYWIVLRWVVRYNPWDATRIYTKTNPFQCLYQSFAHFYKRNRYL